MEAASPNVEQAVASWRRILGAAQVSVGADDLGLFAESTLASAPLPAGVIKVRSRDEVVGVIRTAGEHGVPLYPISRGKNWGYGDACPVGPGQFILDLSGMDRIVEVDPDLAYAVVEPGVSPRQLSGHLEELGYPLWISCTGSSPDASMVGNLVERGFGTTPYSDRAANACGMEVVLADGTVVRTGLDRYPNAPSGHVYRWGLGPHIDGLFTQSNFGVVVRVGIWLLPKPERFVAFSLTMEKDSDLEQAIDRLRELRLAGVLTAPFGLENAMRTLATRRQYPWAETGGATPLSEDMARTALRQTRAHGARGAWNLYGSLYGTRRQLRAGMHDVKAGLRGLGKLRFFSPERLARAERIARPLAALGIAPARRLTSQVGLALSGMDPLRGVPTEGGLSVSRWRLRHRVEGACEDPTGEGCGLYWAAPVCPARGAEVRRCVELIKREMIAGGFEPLIRIHPAGDRAVFVTTLLIFARDDVGEAQRADLRHRELTAKLIDAGFPPERAGVTSMDLLDPNGVSYWEVVGTLRRALDPDGILAPGRYDPKTATKIRTADAAS